MRLTEDRRKWEGLNSACPQHPNTHVTGEDRRRPPVVRTGVLKVWRIPHKQHVSVGRVSDPDEARLVLQRGRDANARRAGVDGAVAVGPTRTRPRHHLTHRHAGVLRRQGEVLVQFWSCFPECCD